MLRWQFCDASMAIFMILLSILWYFYDTSCKIIRKVSFFYIVIYQAFMSNFSRKDDTLRLFSRKNFFRVRIRWAVSLKSIWYETLSIFPKMRHDVDFTTWRRNLSCVTTQRFLRRHVISRAFLSKRRKRKSVGTTWCLFPFLEFLLQFPVFGLSGKIHGV